MHKKTLGEALALIFVAAITIVICSFLYAAIGCWLWGLLIVPVFGLPALTFWQFFGIMCLIRCFVPLNMSIGGDK